MVIAGTTVVVTQELVGAITCVLSMEIVVKTFVNIVRGRCPDTVPNTESFKSELTTIKIV